MRDRIAAPPRAPRPPGAAPTRRTLLRGTALGALALATAGCAYLPSSETNLAAKVDAEPPLQPVVDGPLVYFNWADYIDPGVKAGFSKEYGVPFVESNFDSMESMIAKMDAGNNYDVIFPSAKWTQLLWQGGMLHKLPLDKLVNAPSIFAHYDYFDDPWYDPKSSHSVPFTMYKTGIGWRKDKLGSSLSDSWQDMWDAAAFGESFLLDDRDEVLGFASLKLGYGAYAVENGQLDRITDLVGGLRRNLRGFDSDDYDNLLNGDAWLTQMWSGDMTSVVGQANDPSIYGFEAPKEGAPVNTDCYAIPANARHPGTALLFIDYMLRPENVAKNVAYIGYPMPVHGSENDYEQLVSALPSCMVTTDDLARNLVYTNGSPAEERARDTAWTNIQAG
jgi:spermidine/putrescine transport system substrate-binding protein